MEGLLLGYKPQASVACIGYLPEGGACPKCGFFWTTNATLHRLHPVATLLTIVGVWLGISVPVTILAVCLLRGGHDEDELPISPALENKPRCG
jgi:hypothetical protein